MCRILCAATSDSDNAKTKIAAIVVSNVLRTFAARR